MLDRITAQRAGWLAAGALACWMGASQAQQSPAAEAPAATASLKPAGAHPETPENDALLARTAKLYYSTARDGVRGFACSIHPDWYAVFVAANPNSTIARDDHRVVLLNGVRIILHARMDGSATLDWQPAADPDGAPSQDDTALLDKMHQATEQTIGGFVQFWSQFVSGAVIPPNSDGIEVTPAGDGYRLHSKASGTEVTERFSSSLLLETYDIEMQDASVRLSPSYEATPGGWLVENFDATLRQGAPGGPSQQMHVRVQYQPVEAIPLPSRVEMVVAGAGTFNFDLDGCMVEKQAK